MHDGLDIPFFYSVLNRDIWRLKFDSRLFWLRDFNEGFNWWCYYQCRRRRNWRFSIWGKLHITSLFNG